MGGVLYICFIKHFHPTAPHHIELFHFCRASSSGAACVLVCFPSTQSVELTSIRIVARIGIGTERAVRNMRHPALSVSQKPSALANYTRNIIVLCSRIHRLDIEHRH